MNSDKKRVFCLYRVSTMGQVDKNDIPMQREECQKFCAEQGWEIVDSRSEKGVSGYKKSAEQRDAILDIREAATKGSFDILLVFMSDRLGRREDETPFIVQWFVNHGVEVWSVVEGQQKFESHMDNCVCRSL
jgi:DNA invertase Pin-like site-specific DNA recombinase